MEKTVAISWDQRRGPYVSSAELHKALGVKQHHDPWIGDQFEHLNAIEEVDYWEEEDKDPEHQEKVRLAIGAAAMLAAMSNNRELMVFLREKENASQVYNTQLREVVSKAGYAFAPFKEAALKYARYVYETSVGALDEGMNPESAMMQIMYKSASYAKELNNLFNMSVGYVYDELLRTKKNLHSWSILEPQD